MINLEQTRWSSAAPGVDGYGPLALGGAAAAGEASVYFDFRQKLDPLWVVGPMGETVLMAAGWSGTREIIYDCLTAGIEVGRREQSATSFVALCFAALRRQGTAVETLIAAGAKATDRAGGGQTPLALALAAEGVDWMTAGLLKTVEVLLAAGSDPRECYTAYNVGAYSLIHMACRRGYVGEALALVAAGADPYGLTHPGSLWHLPAGRRDAREVRREGGFMPLDVLELARAEGLLKDAEPRQLRRLERLLLGRS